MAKNRYTARRSAQGYKAPGEREGCHCCAHRSQAAIVLQSGAKGYDCTLGHFLVSAAGICRQYRPVGVAGLTPCINPNHRKSQP